MLNLIFVSISDPIVTGTSVIAVKYKDGIVMAADTLGIFAISIML